MSTTNKDITEWLMELITGLDGDGLVITDEERILEVLTGDEINYHWEYIKEVVGGIPKLD